jgi:putative oxidoreductase
MVNDEQRFNLTRNSLMGEENTSMNTVLWILQILLAVTFLMAGILHGFQQERAKEILKWPAEASPELLTFIGISEILGAIGLVLPALTGILTWLTSLAALGLDAIMLLAILFHLRRGEYPNIVFNLTLLTLAAFVAYGRWVLVPL